MNLPIYVFDRLTPSVIMTFSAVLMPNVVYLHRETVSVVPYPNNRKTFYYEIKYNSNDSHCTTGGTTTGRLSSENLLSLDPVHLTLMAVCTPLFVISSCLSDKAVYLKQNKMQHDHHQNSYYFFVIINKASSVTAKHSRHCIHRNAHEQHSTSPNDRHFMHAYNTDLFMQCIYTHMYIYIYIFIFIYMKFINIGNS